MNRAATAKASMTAMIKQLFRANWMARRQQANLSRIRLSRSQIQFNRHVLKWCLLNAQIEFKNKNLNNSALWCRIGAEVTGFGCGLLSSRNLEEILNHISEACWNESTLEFNQKPKRILHVVTRTDNIGGHNALLRRWIERSPSEQVHTVCVLQWVDPAEKNLKELARYSGGRFIDLTSLYPNPLESADALRKLAFEVADVVILHHHMWDIIPTLAFGSNGGPPCFVLNMADHLFWVGTSICDCILELREEGACLSKKYRTNKDSCIVGVPLPNKISACNRSKDLDIRDTLGIPANSIVFITVGRAPKYIKREGFSFVETAIDILRQVEGSHIIAIGPSEESSDWRFACEQSHGRLHAIGEQTDLSSYFAVSDVYLEGFPFGSLTCLLEAARSGLPCVRAPGSIPSIYRSSGKAFDCCPAPDDVNMYIQFSKDLALMSKEHRLQTGLNLAKDVERHHGTGWTINILEILRPSPHRVNNSEPQSEYLPLKESQLLGWVDGESLVFAAQRARECSLSLSNVSYFVPLAICAIQKPRLLRQMFKALLGKKAALTYIT